jgi:hypothetical protein
MTRRSTILGFAVSILLSSSGIYAGDEPVERLQKEPSEKPRSGGEVNAPDPGRIVKKPAVSTVQSRVVSERCTAKQDKIIETARRAAQLRTQVAVDHARGLHPTTGDDDRREAERFASRLIGDVSFQQVCDVSETIRDRVSNASLKVDCTTSQDKECGDRKAYVVGMEPPIHLCPQFFTGSDEERIRTLIHESAHLARIQQEEGQPESYCIFFDCESNCGGFYSADSWAHFLHCAAGATPDQP